MEYVFLSVGERTSRQSARLETGSREPPGARGEPVIGRRARIPPWGAEGHRGLLSCVSREERLTLACVLDKDSNRALQQLLSVSNTCSGQVLDFSNTSSHPLSPFRLVSAGSKASK